jgi:tetratricopeptide (TPR) repeat protein
MLILRGDVDSAIECLRTSIATDPSRASVHLDLARALRRKGDLHGALEAVRAAVALAPDDVWCHTFLAWHLAVAEPAELRDAGGALRHARSALALGEDANALQNLGVALYVNGELTGAVQALERALAIESDPGGRALCWLFLALAKHGLGDAGGARSAFQSAQASLPQLVESYSELRRFVDEARLALAPAR